jgi:hypothetical protein
MSILTDWVRHHGVLLPSAYAWGEVQPDRLQRFDAALAGAQAVFLGELDHFVHEKADFRLLMLRYLISRGFTRVAEELSWSDGLRVGRYLNGDDAQVERLVGLGYTPDLRTDRSDRPSGVLKASFDAYPVELFAAEQKRFYRGLRAIGGVTDYFGLDVDALPGAAYANVAEALAEIGPNAEVDGWLADLRRVPGESLTEESARVRRVWTKVMQRLSLLGSGERMARVGVSLVHHMHSLDYIAQTYAQTSYEALSPGLAFREQIMKDCAYEALNHGGMPAPLVVMGHALHLLKNDALGGSAGPAGPGGGRVASLGHWLAQEPPMPVFSVWMMWGSGEDSQPFPDLPRRFAYRRGTLNAALAEFSQPVLFPIAGAPGGLFEPPWAVGHMYNQTVEVILAGQVDAILYLPRVSPMRAD